jgi:putative addiction module component (TIGR02574 family)
MERQRVDAVDSVERLELVLPPSHANDSGMSIADIPQLQRLTKDEKLQIIEELWESLDQEVAPWPMTEREKTILDERLDEHEANPGSSIPLKEFKRRWAERK